MVAPSPYYAAAPVRRTTPSLPFGWGTVTVVLVGAALLIIGILLILYGFLNFLTGTIGQAMSSSFSVTALFQSFFGAIMLFVIGGVLAGIGGWLIRLWWIFLLVGGVTGAVNVVNTARERADRESDGCGRCREYLDLIAAMQTEGIRGEVSLKATQFGVLIDRAYGLSEMIPVLEATRATGRVLWLDMESANTTDETIWIGEQLLTRYDRVGICLQANLKRTGDDLERLIRDGARVRLVKGAYKETPEIAYRTRSEIDRAYLSHLETLFTRARHFAVGSHDGRMIDRALALAKAHPTPFEFAMLQGVRDPLKIELVRAGHQVAEYIPYGPNWLPYFTRRLRERPRNVITMVRSFVSG